MVSRKFPIKIYRLLLPLLPVALKSKLIQKRIKLCKYTWLPRLPIVSGPARCALFSILALLPWRPLGS